MGNCIGIVEEPVPIDRWKPMHVLYPSATNDDKNFNFDIILFHSLQSAGWETLWRSTWESPAGAGGNGEDKVCWPAVWLPEDLDGIRVLSVSYDADATKYFSMEHTENNIEDTGENLAKSMKQYGIGQRRFVLVGHGFGGLVIKSLISEMKRLSHIHNETRMDVALISTAEGFLKHLQGIFYYAVPHRNIGTFLKHLEEEKHISGPLKSWKNLEPELEKLSVKAIDGFNGRKINLCSIIEGECTNGKWVVQHEDAMLHVGNHYYRVGNCNHSEVCKPINKEDMRYRLLLDLLRCSGAGKDEGPLYPSLPCNLVGMEESLTKLEEKLEKCSKVGVVGMGGIGKTTLVKAFYRKKTTVNFEAKSILFVNDVYYKSKDVLDCQRRLLQDIVKDGGYDDPRDIEEGKVLLKTFLPEKRVLIVLDDVGEDSIDYLIPEGVQLKEGSKVIVTSRNWSILENHVDEKLNMQFLGSNDAMELFCRCAFKKSCCPYENLQGVTKEFVVACNGLPLSLEVVGSFLRMKQGKRIEFWEGVLGKLKNAQSLNGGADNKLFKTLKLSFDDLEESERGKFLDVVCYFCSSICSNVTKDKALIIWGSVKSHVELENLIDRHLVTINEQGFLSMHDQLLAMGRDILRNEYKHTRISDECDGLKYEDAEKLSDLEGLYLANKSLHDILRRFSQEEMKKMRKLRILFMRECDLSTIAFLSIVLELKQLQWVFLLECSFRKLPSSQVRTMDMRKVMECLKFKLTGLTTMDLQYCKSLHLVPREIGEFKSIKSFDLSGSTRLEQLPAEIGQLKGLTTLKLKGCFRLQHLPAEIGKLTSLMTLDLSKCSRLEQLPAEIGQLIGLTTLDLFECYRLEKLPIEIGKLIGLTTLDLSGFTGLELPAEIGQLIGLTTLYLSWCWRIQHLPAEFGKLTSLTTLDLSRCCSLEQLPIEIGRLTGLMTLDLSQCSSLKYLPAEIGQLISLTTLTLSYCSSLKQLPVEIDKLTGLTTLDLLWCKRLKQLPVEIGKLIGLTTLQLWACSSLQQLPVEISKLTGLTTLKMTECSSLKQLPAEIGKLTGLTTLDLLWCKRLKQLPPEIGKLTGLTTLDLSRCSSLEQLPVEIGKLTGLTTLGLLGCLSLEQLPTEIGRLTGLMTLDLSGCSSLEQVPAEIAKLTGLMTLDLSGCSSLEQVPAEIAKLTGLMTLKMTECMRLKLLPAESGKLIGLTTLDLSGCSSLQQLPVEIGKLTNLTTLNLSRYSTLEQLPVEIGKLTGLTTLDLSGCSSLQQLPIEIGKLIGLTSLNLSGCSNLEQLSVEIGKLTELTTLVMSGCSSLEELPAKLGQLRGLTTFNLSGCDSLKQLPAEASKLTCLTTLDLSGCSTLEQLPAKIGKLTSLTTLVLFGCSSLKQFSPEIGKFTSLMTLDLLWCKRLKQFEVDKFEDFVLVRMSSLEQLPAEIGKLIVLMTLHFWGWSSLEQLPTEIGK